jgi:hypothetical protein
MMMRRGELTLNGLSRYGMACAIFMTVKTRIDIAKPIYTYNKQLISSLAHQNLDGIPSFSSLTVFLAALGP